MRKTRRPPPEPTTPEWRRFVEQKRKEAIAMCLAAIKFDPDQHEDRTKIADRRRSS